MYAIYIVVSADKKGREWKNNYTENMIAKTMVDGMNIDYFAKSSSRT